MGSRAILKVAISAGSVGPAAGSVLTVPAPCGVWVQADSTETNKKANKIDGTANRDLNMRRTSPLGIRYSFAG
jgi:hypothetical protein